MAGFELWDVRSGNLMGDYDTEALALADVAAAIRTHGVAYVDSMMLVRIGPRGGLTRLATGHDLAERARASLQRQIPA